MTYPSFHQQVQGLEVDHATLHAELSGSSPAQTCYVIFFSPRSASTWLYSVLAETQRLGYPEEYLNPHWVRDVAAGLNATEPIDVLHVLLRRRRTTNGVFGIEVRHIDVELFGPQVFFDVFGPQTAFFHLWRRNIVAQGISLYRAVATCRFHSTDPKKPPPPYDAVQIKEWIKHLADTENRNAQMLSSAKRTAIPLCYEELTTDRGATVELFARTLGIPFDAGEFDTVTKGDLSKIADGWSAEAENRFRLSEADFVSDIEGRRSVLAAERTTAAVSSAASGSHGYRYRYSLVACARWEETDIVEWLEYHRSIGFEHAYIYSNDDDPTALHKRLLPYLLQPDPFVTYRFWPKVGDQPGIYLHFLEHFRNETEWFIFLDIDEFLVIKELNNIAKFMQTFDSKADAVYFNWLQFGNANHVERASGSVLLSYSRRAMMIDPTTKVITRSAAVVVSTVRRLHAQTARAFWHFWNDYFPANMRLFNAIGERVVDYTSGWPASASNNVRRPSISEQLIATAFVAHFQFKSEQDFLRRVRRGGFENANHWSRLAAEGSSRTCWPPAMS